ncbi:DNA polymerase III subunit alpha, partial [Bacteroidota bacterium]
SSNMFNLLKTGFRGEILAGEMMQNVGKKRRMLGRLVTTKNVRTVKREWMNFGTFVDEKGEFFDVVNFPNSLKKYPYKGSGIYILLGEITEELGFPGMTVEKMEKMPFKPDPRY